MLERFNKYRLFSELERNYLYYLHLLFYSYLEGNYSQAQVYLSKIINREVNTNFHYLYLKAMPHLWRSMISYKKKRNKKALLSYKKFLRIKSEIDKKNNYFVPVKELISPSPGIFPPKRVYDDLSNLQKIFQKSK